MAACTHFVPRSSHMPPYTPGCLDQHSFPSSQTKLHKEKGKPLASNDTHETEGFRAGTARCHRRARSLSWGAVDGPPGHPAHSVLRLVFVWFPWERS